MNTKLRASVPLLLTLFLSGCTTLSLQRDKGADGSSHTRGSFVSLNGEGAASLFQEVTSSPLGTAALSLLGGGGIGGVLMGWLGVRARRAVDAAWTDGHLLGLSRAAEPPKPGATT